MRHKRLEALIGSPPIRGPERVDYKTVETGGAAALAGQHDGYIERFELKHSRRVSLSADGLRVEGKDKLNGPHGTLRLNRELPFSIHFHLHPDVACQRAAAHNAAEITLRNGGVWNFTLSGANLALEESTFFADSSGPTGALQLVARGTTSGATEVLWVLEKQLQPPLIPEAAPVPEAEAANAAEPQAPPTPTAEQNSAAEPAAAPAPPAPPEEGSKDET